MLRVDRVEQHIREIGVGGMLELDEALLSRLILRRTVDVGVLIKEQCVLYKVREGRALMAFGGGLVHRPIPEALRVLLCACERGHICRICVGNRRLLKIQRHRILAHRAIHILRHGKARDDGAALSHNVCGVSGLAEVIREVTAREITGDRLLSAVAGQFHQNLGIIGESDRLR